MKKNILLIGLASTFCFPLFGQQFSQPLFTAEAQQGSQRQNSHNVFTFDGTQNSVLEFPLPEKAELTVFAVFRSDLEATREQIIWSLENEDGITEVMTNKHLADFKSGELIGFDFKVANQVYLQQYARKKTSDRPTHIYLRGIRNEHDDLPAIPLMGLIGEVRVYDHVLSAHESKVISTYYALKYGLTLSRTQRSDYLSSDCSVLWTASSRGEYSHRITGLGRDTLTGLHQLRSASSYAPDLLIGQLDDPPSVSSTELQHGAHALWGDNDQALRFEKSNQHGIELLLRRWRLESTNWPDGQHLAFTFNTRRWERHPGKNEAYWLAVDHSGTDSLRAGEVELYPGEMDEESGQLHFFGINTNTSSTVSHFTVLIGNAAESPEWNGTLLPRLDEPIEEFPGWLISEHFVYPNPTTDGWVNVAFRLNRAGEVEQRLVNALGTMLQQKKLRGDHYYETQIRLPARGAYFLQIRTGDDYRTIKVVRQ